MVLLKVTLTWKFPLCLSSFQREGTAVLYPLEKWDELMQRSSPDKEV